MGQQFGDVPFQTSEDVLGLPRAAKRRTMATDVPLTRLLQDEPAPPPLPVGNAPLAGLQAGVNRLPNQPSIAELMSEGQNPLASGIEYSGPKLNTEAALSGLRGIQDSHEAESQRSYIPSEELWKQSFRDPQTTAPGAGPGAAHELNERLGDQDFMKGLEQRGYADVSGAETAMNPIVQAGAEANARRATYPAQVAAQGNIETAKIQTGPMQTYYNALAKMMQGGTQGIKSVSRSGITLGQVPTQLYTNLQNAQKASAQGQHWWGRDAGASAMLTAAQKNILDAMPDVQPHVKQALLQHLQDPNTPLDASTFTPEEQSQMNDLFDFLSGGGQ